MATATGRIRCDACHKQRVTYKCRGCSLEFCFGHLKDHRQELGQQLDKIEVTRDLFRQSLTEQTKEPQKQSLIQQINEWELESIDKIRHTAEEARQTLLKHTAKHSIRIEDKLSKLTNKIREHREEDDFFEDDLRQWNEELTRLQDQLIQPSNNAIRQDLTPLVTKMSVNVYDGM
jgi:chromosome segregation ATPase